MQSRKAPSGAKWTEGLLAWIPWGFAVLALAFTSVRIFVPAVGTLRDDGIYLSCARALATGKGYVIDILPGEPLNTKYPPLTSLLVAPLFAAGLDPVRHFAAFKAVPFAFLILWLLGLRRLGLLIGLGAGAVGWVIACTVASAWVAYCSTMILSDIPAAALITWGLALTIASVQPGQQSFALPAAAGVLLGLAFLTRTHSAAAIAGIVLYLLTRRRWSQLAALSCSCLILTVPWIFWVNSVPAVQDPVLQYYSGHSYRGWWAWNTGSFDKAVQVVFLNLAMFLAAPSQSVAFGSPILGAGAFIPVLVIAMKGFGKQQLRLLLYAILTSVVIALFWQWRPSRLLLFVFPLIWSAASAAASSLHRRILAGAALLLCLQGLWLQGNQIPFAFVDANPPLPVGRGDDWNRLRRIAEWLRLRTNAGETIAALQEGAVALLAERKAVFPVEVRPFSLIYEGGLSPLGTPAEMEASLKRMRIRYIVRTPSLVFAEAGQFDRLIGTLHSSPDGCLHLATDWGSGYRVYEHTCLDQDSSPPRGSPMAP